MVYQNLVFEYLEGTNTVLRNHNLERDATETPPISTLLEHKHSCNPKVSYSFDLEDLCYYYDF